MLSTLRLTLSVALRARCYSSVDCSGDTYAHVIDHRVGEARLRARQVATYSPSPFASLTGQTPLSIPTAVSSVAPSKRVVWVIDDSAFDRQRAQQVLGGECVVELFQDGSTALERLAVARPPDVMVLDWVMPGVNGVDLCRFLRSAQGGHQEVGVLLLTAHRDTDQIVEGLSAGANDYLAKPYADAELLARVRALLRARQMLERAEQAEALNLKLLQTAPDPLIALDENRRIRFANEAACVALEQSSTALFGERLADVLPTLDRYLDPSQSSLTLADVKVGEKLYSPSLRSMPNAAFHTVASLRDVTERRRVDARRLDFYSVVAHDLRTPLNTLTLRTRLILDGKNGELSAGMRSDVLKIDANLTSLVTMINDFLDLARLENVAYRLDNHDVDLVALLADTVENLRPQLEANQLRWVDESLQPIQVCGDQRRLQQVLTNLISNAIKFTDAHGTITTRVSRRDQHVEVSVTDTGRGIAAEHLTMIFDRYTRATDSKVPGTGLGLMIVREIVEAHGGRVGVESIEGKGSRFWFRLPATLVSTTTPVPELHPNAPPH